jgi:hypothetical protein
MKNICTIYKRKGKGFVFALFILGGVLFSRCRKLINVDPPATSITGPSVYTSDATAVSVLTGVYDGFSGSSNIGFMTSLLPGLSADEFSVYGNYNSQYTLYYTNTLSSINAGFEFWNTLYPFVYTINAAIDGLNNSTGLTPAIKTQLLGEAKFTRAFCYFYLTNLYGDCPLVTGIDYIVNSKLTRTPQSQVWAQIITDLTDAQNELSDNYLDATLLNQTTERVRPTKWAATALLARSYLYKGVYDSAELEATEILNNTGQYSLTSLDSVFLANSNEAVWQLQPINQGANTAEGRNFILPSSGPSSLYDVYTNPILVNSFESGDARETNWLASDTVNGTIYYYPYKYKVSLANLPVTEYEMVLRLGEQYLVRAEARAQQGETTGALADLNVIRSRANLPNYTGPTDQASLITAILHEKQIELFSEWGHRWMDLKRSGTVNSVLGSPGNVCSIKGGTWEAEWQLYPLPLTDLKTDLNLVQNSGY